MILIHLNQHTASMGTYSSCKTHHQDVKLFVCVKAQLLGCKTMAAPKHDGCIQSVLIYQGMPALEKSYYAETDSVIIPDSIDGYTGLSVQLSQPQ